MCVCTKICITSTQFKSIELEMCVNKTMNLYIKKDIRKKERTAYTTHCVDSRSSKRNFNFSTHLLHFHLNIYKCLF